MQLLIAWNSPYKTFHFLKKVSGIFLTMPWYHNSDTRLLLYCKHFNMQKLKAVLLLLRNGTGGEKNFSPPVDIKEKISV